MSDGQETAVDQEIAKYNSNSNSSNAGHELQPDDAGKVSRCFGKRECMPHSLFCFKVWLLNYINIHVFNMLDTPINGLSPRERPSQF